MKHRLYATATAILLAGACGNGKGATAPLIAQDPGPTSTRDGGPPDDAVAQDPLAPVVAILDPLPAADPNQDTVVTSDSIVVRCRVTKSTERRARDVDQSSVAISAVWTDTAGKDNSMPAAVNAISDTEFEGKLALDDIPNGKLRLRCTAKDLFQAGPVMGWSNVDTFLDLGPKIDILDPKEGAIRALIKPVVVTFRVKAVPVSDLDQEADVTDLALTISNQQFATTPSDDDPTLYTTTVDFDDATVFPMPPSAAQIAVSAKSSRTPEPGHRSARVNIQLDAAGPTIVVKQPGNDQIVRGEVVLSVDISDPSGVDPKMVVADINRGGLLIQDWNISGTTFSQRFDTLAFGKELTELQINLTAADTVGNVKTASHRLRLDNVPPMLSLDPPMVRESTTVSGATQCSTAFDPLGAAVNDLDISFASTLFRVMVDERTNVSPGKYVNYEAGLDLGSVKIYLQRPDLPLLIDTDHDPDNLCDEIDLSEDHDKPTIYDMQAVTVGGTAFYAADDGMTHEQSLPPVAPDYCHYGNAAPPDPSALCANSHGMTRAINQIADYVTPAIFAKSPTNAHDLSECAGGTVEAGPLFTGWVCVAARAQDNIGNVGVSPPIRVCYPGVSSDPHVCDLPAPPCTTMCKKPLSFEDLGGTVMVPKPQ